jgi:hypothetical protein
VLFVVLLLLDEGLPLAVLSQFRQLLIREVPQLLLVGDDALSLLGALDFIDGEGFALHTGHIDFEGEAG